jgi:uncharacterized protein YprB with RNaseH-like and TPR domain
MLQDLNICDVLFLDIETVPQFERYDELPDESKKLWEEKSRFMRERKQTGITESYGDAGIYAEFGKIVCVSVGYFPDETSDLRLKSFFGHDERDILKHFSEMLEEYHHKPFRLLCAHNGKEFDFPYLCRRMLVNRIRLPELLNIAGKKPWEIPHLDTMELWKFGDYKHYTSLRLLASIFGIPSPKDDVEGSDVRNVYYTEGDLQRIERYCRKDVATVAMLLQAYRGKTDMLQTETASLN